MATINQVTHQANSMSLAEEELLRVEIVGALPHGSGLQVAAFAQLQGSPDPFKVAIEVLDVLPEGLRQRR